MTRIGWKELLWTEARDGISLERLVRRNLSRYFDSEDRKVLKLVKCDQWEQVFWGVRQELRCDRGLPFDRSAPCFEPARTIYHPIRRILMPGVLMAASKARRNPNKVVTA